MKFSEMTYTRPDIDALLATCKALAAKAAAAPDGDALVAVYYEQSRAFADYTTASQLANIHYTCDTRDAYWKAEQDFFGNVQTPFKLVNSKVIVAGNEEVTCNPRSRSAKLRIAEKR